MSVEHIVWKDASVYPPPKDKEILLFAQLEGEFSSLSEQHKVCLAGWRSYASRYFPDAGGWEVSYCEYYTTSAHNITHWANKPEGPEHD